MKAGETEAVEDFNHSSLEMAGVANFHRRIQFLVSLAGSVAELARISGCSESSIHAWKADRSEPTLTNLVNLANACGVHMHWLAVGETPVFLELTADELKHLGSLFNDYWMGYDEEVRREVALVHFKSAYSRGKEVTRLPGILRFSLDELANWVVYQRLPEHITLTSGQLKLPYFPISEKALRRAYRLIEDEFAGQKNVSVETRAELITQMARTLSRQELLDAGVRLESSG